MSTYNDCTEEYASQLGYAFSGSIVQLETLQLSASERPRYMTKAAAIHYLNVRHSGKSRSRPAK